MFPIKSVLITSLRTVQKRLGKLITKQNKTKKRNEDIKKYDLKWIIRKLFIFNLIFQ